MPSIIGWIKNGRKGKNVAYMPASYPSERVAYGNGTVKDALDGLTEGVSYDYTTSQTFSQIITALASLVDSSKITPRSVINSGSGIFSGRNFVLLSKSASIIYSSAGAGSADIRLFLLNITNKTFLDASCTSNSFSRVDISANYPTVNGTITLYY